MLIDQYIGRQYGGIHNIYKVTKHLASGGMGHVYVANSSKNQDEVVIKFPALQDLNGNQHQPAYYNLLIQKLKVESNILKGLISVNSPFIVKYVDESKDSRNYFLVTKKILGHTLTKYVKPSGMPESDIIKKSLDVLQGLEILHKRNILYRDMKPDNIMVTNNDNCILIDFGGAKQGVTQVNSISGNNATQLETPGWTCPEQNSGRASAECDLYAFGRVMFFMATGIPPIRQTLATGKMKKTVREINHLMSQAMSNLINDIIDPNHNTFHTTTQIINSLKSMQSRIQYNQTSSPKHIQSIPQQKYLEPFIVLENKTYKVSNKPGGLLIGKKHDIVKCMRKNGDCNKRDEGDNIPIGWDCPSPNCRCDLNPGHKIEQHSIRMWKDKSGNICIINYDSQRRSAINRNGRWVPMIHDVKEILRNNDQVALLYNESKGPYQSFTFHLR